MCVCVCVSVDANATFSFKLLCLFIFFSISARLLNVLFTFLFCESMKKKTTNHVHLIWIGSLCVIAIMANRARIACMSITLFAFSECSQFFFSFTILRERKNSCMTHTMWFSCLSYEVYATNTRYGTALNCSNCECKHQSPPNDIANELMQESKKKRTC